MNFLITGASGFIGRHLSDYFVTQGHEVWGLSRTPQRYQKKQPSTYFVQDLTQLDGVDIDVLINLAGQPLFKRRWSHAYKQQLIDSRCLLTQQLVDYFAKREAPSHVINGSAIGFYGTSSLGTCIETSLAGDDFAASLCVQWEAAAAQFKTLGSRLCIIRTGLVMGNTGGMLKQMLPAFRFGLGGTLGDGEQWMSWIHILDMVKGIDFLCQHDCEGVFNFSAPNPVTNAEFTQTLAQCLRRPALLPMPSWLLKGLLGEMADLMLTGQYVVPQHLNQKGYQFEYPNLDVALQSLLT